MSDARAPRRAAVAGAAALVSVTTALFSPAGAAAPGACARFNDDQRGVIEENFGEPHRDMLAGRLRSDRTHLTAVMIVGLIRPDPPQPDDRLLNYAFSFDVGAVRVFLSASGDSSVRPSYGVVVAGRPVVLGEPELVRDRKNREYRLRAPLAAFAPLVDLSPGATATGMTASVLLEPGIPGAPPGARAPVIVLDLADGRTTTYTFGAGACTMKTRSR